MKPLTTKYKEISPICVEPNSTKVSKLHFLPDPFVDLVNHIKTTRPHCTIGIGNPESNSDIMIKSIEFIRSPKTFWGNSNGYLYMDKHCLSIIFDQKNIYSPSYKINLYSNGRGCTYDEGSLITYNDFLQIIEDYTNMSIEEFTEGLFRYENV